MITQNGNGRHTSNGHSGFTVSVITSCYNTAKYVEECVRSVQSSIVNDKFTVEHILVGGGSTDGTMDLLHQLSYELVDSKIPVRVVELGCNLGKPSRVRNEGIKRATGKYLFCLDDDDVILQNTLRYFVEHFRHNPNIRWAYSDFLRGGPKLEYVIGFDYYGWPHATPQDLLYSVFKGEHFYQHSLMFERSMFVELGGYDPYIKIGEDLDLCIRFVLAGFMPAYLNFNSHIHREHGSNMTASFGIIEHMQDIANHYRKHRSMVSRRLTPAQIDEIDEIVRLVPAPEINSVFSSI